VREEMLVRLPFTFRTSHEYNGSFEVILVCQNYELTKRTHPIILAISGIKMKQNGTMNLLPFSQADKQESLKRTIPG